MSSEPKKCSLRPQNIIFFKIFAIKTTEVNWSTSLKPSGVAFLRMLCWFVSTYH